MEDVHYQMVAKLERTNSCDEDEVDEIEGDARL
jgi:hypothetical protein